MSGPCESIFYFEDFTSVVRFEFRKKLSTLLAYRPNLANFIFDNLTPSFLLSYTRGGVLVICDTLVLCTPVAICCVLIKVRRVTIEGYVFPQLEIALLIDF